jgi:Fe-S-cluster containining protein
MSAPASDTLDAGPFGAWRAQMSAVLRGRGESEVACGTCVGCCTSSYFIPVDDDETETLAVLPQELLVRAPGQYGGRSLLGYRDNGHCPMFDAGRGCTIYAKRPRTCRDYDCRVFAAAGAEAGGGDRSTINQRIRQWRFTFEDSTEQRRHDAMRAVARFIREHGASFPRGRAPRAPGEIAVVALKAHEVFLDTAVATRAPEELALAIIAATRAFDAAEGAAA